MQRKSTMAIVLGALLIIAGIVAAVVGAPVWAVILILAGILVLLVELFRRRGRKGDFSRSGWTGS
jgi:Flp pilus assembly protein TadB